MPGQVRLAALRAFIRPTKNLCSNRCRDGMSAVPLCLNPPAGVPLKAGNGGNRPRLLPPFRRFRAATRGCIRMRPEQGACSRRHPSLQLRSATYSPGHRFFRSDGFRQPIGCVSIFQFIFHQAVPVVNRRTPASAPTFKEKDPARTARGGHGTINRKRRHPSGERHRRSVRDSLPGRSGTSRRQGLAARPRGRCPILDRPNV